MKVYCVQLDIAWEQNALNHARVFSLLEACEPEPGSLVVLPEMFASGFSMNVAKISDSEMGETQSFLAASATAFNVFIVGGVVETTTNGRGLNQALVYDPQGREVARYTKMQPFSLGGESDHYDAGESVVTFKWGGFSVAPFVCYDLRFPEHFRAAVHAGATMYTVIANWPERRSAHWVSLLQARAIENQAYVIGVNRCGRDPFLEYSGGSMVIEPSGAILIEAGDIECVVSAEIDLESLTAYRSQLPFLADAKR
ncbi:MAG: carbon-nitrogen family hydrolase [Acidobacteriota bacterium]